MMSKWLVHFLVIILLTTLPFFLQANDNEVKHYLVDKVQMFELNHFYDEQGRLVFDQFIFWDNYPGKGETLVIREWRLAKSGRKTYTEDEKKEKIKEARVSFLKENKIKPNANPDWLNNIGVWEPEWVGDSEMPKGKDQYGSFITIFENKGNGFYRKIYYNTECETFSQIDPELVDREVVPKDKRIPFKEGPKSKLYQVELPPLIQTPAADAP